MKASVDNDDISNSTIFTNINPKINSGSVISNITTISDMSHSNNKSICKIKKVPNEEFKNIFDKGGDYKPYNIPDNENNYTKIISNDETNNCTKITPNDDTKSICKDVLHIDNSVLNKIYIDVAVLCEEYTHVGTICEDHILNLDEIEISMEVFQHIFYPYKENFGINRDFLNNNKHLLPYISFLPEFRSINDKKFYLLEELISNIETDLSISRYCFTKESLVELTNEITSIRSLLDINCCSVLSSLTWSNILEIIKNYNLVKCGEIVPILIINIVFKTPTEGVKDSVVRFQYKISNVL